MNRRVAAKVAVSAALLAWLLSRTPLQELAAALARLTPAALALGLVLSFAAWWLSGVRLWTLAFEFPLHDVVRMTWIGLYYGTVLPGQVAGDVVKAYRLSTRQSVPGRAAAATLVDRALAVLALFALGAAAAPWVPQAPRMLGVTLAALTVAGFAALGVMLHPRVRRALASGLSSASSTGIRALPGRLAMGLEDVMGHPGRLLANAGLAVGFHALCLAIHLAIGASLGIALSVSAWMLVYAGVSLLMLAPVTVAGLGLREGGYVGLLGLLGVSAADALSLSFVLFAYALCGALVGFLVEIGGRSR